MTTYCKFTGRITAAALSLVMLLALVPASVSASGADTDKSIYNNVGDCISKQVDDKPVYRMEWYVTALARAGRLSSASAEMYLQSVKDNAPNDTDTKKTALVMALTALGKDATNFNGVNYLDEYKDNDSIKAAGYSSTEAYILASVDCGNYWSKLKASGGNASPDEIVKHLLDQKLSSGGWGYKTGDGTEVFNVDTTAMVIQGLAPYYADSDVKSSVDQALDLLGKAQESNGGYVAWGSENSASTSQVILALTSLGIDPDNDARFIKDGTLIGSLEKFYVKDAGFALSPGAAADSFSTYQGYMAMTAYYRLKENKKPFFDMSDAVSEPMKVSLTAATGNRTEVGMYTKLTADVKNATGTLTYKFIVHNETTNQWYRIRDFEKGNTVDWCTGPAGQKTLYVDVMTNGDKNSVVRAAFPISVAPTELKADSFTSSRGTYLGVNKNTELKARAAGGTGCGYTYKFIVYNRTTNQWWKIRDWSGSDRTDWFTGPKGNKVLYVDIKDNAGNYVRQALNVQVS